MSTNKKPRKRYQPKAVRNYCVDKDAIDEMFSAVSRAELAAEMKLPRGTTSRSDNQYIRTLFNHALTGIGRRGYLDLEERKAAIDLIQSGDDAMKSMARRCSALRPEAPVYVCTAAELQAIRSAVEVAAAFIRDSYETVPVATMMEFYAMCHFIRQIQKGSSIVVTTSEINRFIRLLERTPAYRWGLL